MTMSESTRKSDCEWVAPHAADLWPAVTVAYTSCQLRTVSDVDWHRHTFHIHPHGSSTALKLCACHVPFIVCTAKPSYTQGSCTQGISTAITRNARGEKTALTIYGAVLLQRSQHYACNKALMEIYKNSHCRTVLTLKAGNYLPSLSPNKLAMMHVVLVSCFFRFIQ